jgi:hypothetical protein
MTPHPILVGESLSTAAFAVKLRALNQRAPIEEIDMNRPYGPSDQLVATVDQLIYSGAVRYQNPARVREDVLTVCVQTNSLVPRSGLLPTIGAFFPFALNLGFAYSL